MTDGERDLVPFSRALQRAMQDRGWTELKLVEKSGLSKGTVSNMLAGVREGASREALRRRPRRDNVVKLANALDESAGDWLRLAGWKVTEDEQVSEEGDLLKRITQGLEHLNPAELRIFARMIRGMMVDRGAIDLDVPPAQTLRGEHPEIGTYADPITEGTRSGPADIVDDTSHDPRRAGGSR